MLRKNSKGNNRPSILFCPPARRATHQTPRSHCSVVRYSVRTQLAASAVWSSMETWRVWRGSSAILGNIRPISRLLGLSSPAPTTMNANQNEPDNSPGNTAEHGDEEAWSGDDDPSDIDGADASGKRKRQRLSRPLSVSCELCKSRKVARIIPFVHPCHRGESCT
jgi:hypothetical protein